MKRPVSPLIDGKCRENHSGVSHIGQRFFWARHNARHIPEGFDGMRCQRPRLEGFPGNVLRFPQYMPGWQGDVFWPEGSCP